MNSLRIDFKENDSYEDFKAAFICVNDGAKGYLKTSDELLKALQGCGRNPDQRTISRYWKEYNKIGLDEFCEIASKEHPPNEQELIQAFKAIDTDSNGFISINEFIDVFSKEGDAMEIKEIRKIMDEADLNKDQMLNYKEFSRLIIDTIQKSKKAARSQMKKIVGHADDQELFSNRSRQSSKSSKSNGPRSKDYHESDSDYESKKHDKLNKNLFKSELNRTRSIDSLKSPRKKSDFDDQFERRNSSKSLNRNSSPKKNKNFEPDFEVKIAPASEARETLKYPKNFKKWFHKSIKGGFYFNEISNGIIANSFALDLQNESSLFFSIETFKTPLHTNYEIVNMDVSLLIVKNNKSLSVKGFTENKIENKWCTRLDLSPGRYYLFPFTTGCHLKRRASDYTKNEIKLFQKDLNGKTTLSRQFKDALGVIFDLFDLDSNGRISQDELNLHSFITANEDIPDEEWKFVGELVGFEKNELTKDGFIKLHAIEAKREDKDVDEINKRLANLGFNKSLSIDQSCPFNLTVSSEEENFEILLSEIYETKSSETFLKQIFESKGISKRVKGLDDVNLIEYHNEFWSCLILQNDSRQDLNVFVDCSNSENCLSNTNDLRTNVRIKSKKNKIIMYLTHLNPRKEMKIQCSVTS
ncbi:unnamed protein product [Brachionus calyciflorus]|uniref:EF-hand domain-containing protein n=1 Tax=Brachionus calyciflorus TaxID=104777 RepID=A0A813RMU7_9BILA|nr:unnamed protein product [Brachionus calyciflorus]